MKHTIAISGRLLGKLTSSLVLGVAVVAASAQEKAKVSPVDEVHQALEPLLSDPLYLKLNPNRALWKEDKYGNVIAPNEAPEHPEGVFWISDLRFIPPVGVPPQFFGYGQSHVRTLDAQHIISQEQCQQWGLAFLQRQFAWVFSKDRPLLVRVKQPVWNSGYSRGVWEFNWWQTDQEGLAETLANAQVRAMDGRVVGFSIQKRGIPPHELQFSKIKPSVLQFVSQDKKLKNIVVGPVVIADTTMLTYEPNIPKLVFKVEVSAQDAQSGDNLQTTFALDTTTGKPVWIDLSTGRPTDPKIEWSSSEGGDGDVLPSSGKSVTMPLWVNQKLMRITTCRSTGIPTWIPLLPQVVLSGTTGPQQITQDLEVSPRALYGLPNSSWFGMERRGWTYGVNAQTGDYRVLGTPQSGGATPTISSDGKWAVVAATGHLGSADADLFADNLQRDPDLQLRARLVIPKSEESFPLFSPDGKWLYFVSIALTDGKVTQILRRIPAALAQVKDLVRLKPEQITDIMPLPLEEVARLSVFPTGQNLLLQAIQRRNTQQMYLLDLTTRKATPLKIPALKDAELSGAPITKLEDGWAGPSDGEVTFSGETTDAAKVVRRRIYSCRFDGSGLKVLTPKDNTPVPAYTFAASKKSATDLAKEWALREIAWDKAHADR